MSTVVLLPLYQPMVVAKLTSVLDVASDGRYHMGIGIGGEFPKEFEACGVPVKQRGSRSNEALEVIKKLWTEKDVTFEGRFTKVLRRHPLARTGAEAASADLGRGPQRAGDETRGDLRATAGFPTCTRRRCCTRASRRLTSSARKPAAI